MGLVTNQSLFLIAAVTVLLIMLPGLANASTTSEGFETYTNEDYGFSIEYPSNFDEYITALDYMLMCVHSK